MSDTPETDANSPASYAIVRPDGTRTDYVPADFARKLERERNEAREDAKRATYDATHETIKVSTVKSHWIEACRERDEAREALKDANESVVTFGVLWAAQYAADHGLPKGHLHPTHYDILQKAGARMNDFTRADLQEDAK